MPENTNKALDKALEEAYREALKTIIIRNKEFLKKWQDVQSGKYPCPAYWKNAGKEDYWRRGFLNEIARQFDISRQIMDVLDKVGEKSAKTIEKQLYDEYGHGFQGEVMRLVQDAHKAGIVMNPVVDKRAVRIAVDDAQVMAPMSKIKFAELGKNTQVRERLQRELGASIASGESLTKLTHRIADVVMNAEHNAARTAQTELNRVRNQSSYEAAQYAEEEYGIESEQVWQCRYQNSRDGHMEVSGTVAKDGGWMVPWKSGKKSGVDFMRYPGDPHGSAANVCNCHCYLQNRIVTDSPTMRKIREENDRKRREFQEQYGNNWRDIIFGKDEDGKWKHPYARK